MCNSVLTEHNRTFPQYSAMFCYKQTPANADLLKKMTVLVLTNTNTSKCLVSSKQAASPSKWLLHFFSIKLTNHSKKFSNYLLSIRHLKMSLINDSPVLFSTIFGITCNTAGLNVVTMSNTLKLFLKWPVKVMKWSAKSSNMCSKLWLISVLYVLIQKGMEPHCWKREVSKKNKKKQGEAGAEGHGWLWLGLAPGNTIQLWSMGV